ncbi:MAG: NAD-dependent epimerase/dehydratase family protein [Polyangiaceae bacterium]
MSQEIVVVTGGAGFIGSHCVGALLAEGHRVVVLDNYVTGKRENLAGFADSDRLQAVECDVRDGIWAPLSAVERDHGPVTRIIHLAAQTSVVASIGSPVDDLRVNAGATVQVLEYARHRGVKRVVLASSAAVYGDVERLPVSEDAPLSPLSPYGIHKLTSEMHLRYYRKVHGVRTAPLRFFNVYGPRQDPHSPYSGVISIFMARALAGRDILIFGDGEQTRDFVYVGDVVRAILGASFSDEAGDGEPMNVGTGRETSINELAKILVAATGSASSVRHAEARAGEILRSVAEVGRLRERLGVVAETSVADGLAETVAWMKAPG